MNSRQWVQKQRKIFCQRSQERSRELSAMKCQESKSVPLWMKKGRNIRCHTVLIDTLKTETSNFVLNPSLHWKPVEKQIIYYMQQGRLSAVTLSVGRLERPFSDAHSSCWRTKKK